MLDKQKALQEPLTADQIDFRVQSINKGGYATILAYKDARVDMNRLNDVFGIGYWQRKHERIDGKEFCSVGVWNDELNQWAWVQDCGTESFTEAQKGQSSDAFKRACFNLGIGIELYDYPLISIKLFDDEFKIEGDKVKQTWNLRLRDWSWQTFFDQSGSLAGIKAVDDKGRDRFVWKSGERPYNSHAVFGSKVSEHWDSINCIKCNFAEGDLSSAAEAWHEISEEDRMILSRAPTKGGVFTKSEVDIFRSNEFKEACKACYE